MPPYNISLRFRGDRSLRRATNLLLAFDQQGMPGIYDIYNPIAWRVTSFPAGGGGDFGVTYSADLAFTRAQVEGGILQPGQYSTHINPGEQTTLTQDTSIQPPTFAFSKPEPWNNAPRGNLRCSNKTGNRQDIGIGFFSQSKVEPNVVLVVGDVPGNTDVVASFTPVLSAYVVTGYQQNQIIGAQIQGDLGWHKDLSDNRTPIAWLLIETNDGFQLIEDRSASALGDSDTLVAESSARIEN